MFVPSTLTPLIASCPDTRTKVACLLTGIIGQMRDFAGEAVTLRYLSLLEAEAVTILDAIDPLPIAEPIFDPAPKLAADIEDAQSDAPKARKSKAAE